MNADSRRFRPAFTRAFAKLNQSIDDHEPFIGFMKVDPFMNPLRGDARFFEVMKKAGLPQ
jgi:hypothetical protein